ncbi:MAG: FAD-dependent oxidoreductase [Verrucomicrobiota bacterium]
MSGPKRLAIVGAGPAGLAAAWKLRNNSRIEKTIFEKSRGLAGRAASRSRHGVRLDPGANYIKTGSPLIEDLMLRQLPTDDLVQIDGDIWVHNERGEIQPGDPEQNREPKWTYRTGISTIGKLLAAESNANIIRETRIEEMSRSGSCWTLKDANGASHGPFDIVLLTPPGPQTVALLETCGSKLTEVMGQVEYHRQFCFAFGFEGVLERPGDFHALINLNAKHPIAWLSFENDKPGHVPLGITVVGAQMQPAWSLERFDDEVGALAEVALGHVVDMLGWNDVEPLWFDSQRWKFAHPFTAAAAEQARAEESTGLFLAGDAFAGKGRVNLALESGIAAAERLAAH